MKESGLYFILRKLLDAKTKGEADAYISEYVGDEYLKIAREVLGRITYNRTRNQNSTLHGWYSAIAKHRGDVTASEVKGECHHAWALPIRLRDEKFAWLWERTGALLPHEKQCSLLASETLSVSSAMTTSELSEYMGEIEQYYRHKGVPLVTPKEVAA